jgi:hypothetical protein
MKRTLQLSILLLFITIVANAQYSMSLYVDDDTDGNTAWATETVQFSPGYNCTMCQYASHTYSGQAQISDPNNNQINCFFNESESAAYAYNAGCEADIAVSVVPGSYAAGFSTSNKCTQIGTILAIGYFLIQPIHIAVNSYAFVGRNPSAGTMLFTSYGLGCPNACTGNLLTQYMTPIPEYVSCLSKIKAGVCIQGCFTPAVPTPAPFCTP